MKIKIKLFSFLVLFFFFFSCEKRIDLEKEFPSEEDRVFCEIIGLVETGFFGTVTQIQKVGSIGQGHQPIQAIIREEGNVIFDQVLYSNVFVFFYEISDNTNYTLEIKYKDQVITSPARNTASPIISIENLISSNDFIDSLGFHVASFEFNFITPGTEHDEYHYTYLTEVTPWPWSNINLLGTEPAEIVSGGATEFISKRIPNIQNYPYGRSTLISLDKPLFQYLKNINLLGTIPNDDIEGHQGNLDGGIGYFGVVNFDMVITEF